MTDIAIKIEYIVPGLHMKNMHSETFVWKSHMENLWGSSGILDQESRH